MQHLKRILPRRVVARMAIITMVALAGVGLGAVPASASYIYSINVTQACQEQGHFANSFWNTGPYGWYCYDLALPSGVSPAGGVDMQGWCNRHYPGATAIIYQYNLYGWRCSRNW